MAEPRGAFLLAAGQRDPIIAAATQALPRRSRPVSMCIRITTITPVVVMVLSPPGPANLLGGFKGPPRHRTHPMREALVVPERGVLQHQPSPRLADPAPSFALVAMSAHPFGRV